MGSFSSKPKKRKAVQITAIDRTVLDLKNARDRLQKYRTKLARDEERLLLQAKKYKESGRTDTALSILRLKKFKEQQAKSCEDQLLNVLQMVETIDSKQNDAVILNAMKSGKDTLQSMQQETTVEDVLDLMEDIADAHATEQEITDILSGVPELSVEAEAAVEQELEQLQAELSGTTTTVDLPTVPTHKLPEVVVPAAQQVPQSTEPERVAVPG